MGKKKKTSTSDVRTVNGKAYLRALTYALKACPKGDDAARLAHVVFIGSRIVAADGDRWHIGHLQGFEIAAPLVAARSSVEELVLALEYTQRIARRHGGAFFVHQDHHQVTIQYGEDQELEHELIKVNVGHIPLEWSEPVAANAPTLDAQDTGAQELRAAHMKDAMSWAKESGTFTIRGKGGDQPVRFDCFSGGELVATAIVLPADHAPAQLAPDEPLLAKLSGAQARGQSILDLQLDLQLPAPPSCIKIGDVEINITGLGDPEDLLKTGPCSHRETDDPCLPCTEAAVSEARAEQVRQADKVVPISAGSNERVDTSEPAPY